MLEVCELEVQNYPGSSKNALSNRGYLQGHGRTNIDEEVEVAKPRLP